MSIPITVILLTLLSEGRTDTVVTDTAYEYGIFENFDKMEDVFRTEQQLVKQLSLIKGIAFSAK